jgi:regulatory protein|tara:strand:- start:2354 stop:2914 length:561 start_codon:yes stop_codon:yes gene_type:complete
MDPISNKKEFEDLTANLRDLAYSYIEKYNPSKQQIKTYLLKKYLKKFQGTKVKKEITEIIDKIVLNLEKNKLLNDSLYSDSKARSLFRRGYSLNKITHSLRSKGIEQNNIKMSIEKIKKEKSDPDFTSAMKICKKKRIGPMRPESNRELFYKKDMGILARSGFNYEISKKILSMSTKEFNQLIKLI